MKTVFTAARELLTRGEPFVLATVVRTKGSTPQKPGAKLIVRADGGTVGTLGGGCVEADVWAAARRILDGRGTARVEQFTLDEDIAAADGLVCGGTMEILIDPVTEPNDLGPLVDEILAAYEGAGERALAVLLPRDPLSQEPHMPPEGQPAASERLFLRADGSSSGTLGNAHLDLLVREVARDLMPRGLDRWLETPDGRSIYVETYTHPTTVVIAGAGHVGKALHETAVHAGFRTVILDDRPRFAAPERFPGADRVVVDAFDSGLRKLRMGPNHFVVVATRGHKHDDLALLEAARSGAGYIGLLGSRRKAVMIFRDLIRRGIPEERIRRIRAPVGLDVGGRQPEEIAVSIVAELLAVKYGRSGAPMTLAETVLDQARRLAARA